MSIFNTEPRDRTESAALLEKRKTPEGRAEDIAYTINHAIVCAATDVIDPFFAAGMQKHFGKNIHISQCNKTHDHGNHDEHKESHKKEDAHKECNSGKKACSNADHAKDKKLHKKGGHKGCAHHHGPPTFWGSLKHWLKAEAVGDIGAVPITIGAQYFAPSMMSKIGHGIESLVGNDYRASARRAAKEWAGKQNIPLDDARVKERENDIYNHEIDHFGQVGVWTASSVGINIGYQKFVSGNSHPWKHLLLYKTIGAAQTAAVLMGGRALYPEKFRDMDQWTTKNLYLPTTKLLGLDSDAVENVIKKHEDLHGHDTAPEPSASITTDKAASEVLIPEHLQR